MLRNKSKYNNIFTKVTAVMLIHTLVFSACASHALAPWSAFQNPQLKREMSAVLQRTRVIYAESDEAKRLLEANNADALLLSHGKYLVKKDVADNPIRLIRSIIHEDIEALMQILAQDDRYVYNGLKELILNNREIKQYYYDLCHEGKEPRRMTPELMLNDMVAKALEIMFAAETGLALEEDHKSDEDKLLEARFYLTIKKIILANRHNYFRDGLFISEKDSRIRSERIRQALTKGMQFYQAANTAAEKPLGEKCHAEIFRTIKEWVDITELENSLFGIKQKVPLKKKHYDTLYRGYGFLLTEESVAEIFDKLSIKKGDTLLDIGPGHAVLSIMAAIMGAKVTVVELSAQFLIRYQEVAKIFKDEIEKAGGELNIIHGDITQEGVKAMLRTDCFSQIMCINVINEEPVYAQKAMEALVGIDLSAPHFGVRDRKKQKDIINTILRVMKKDESTFYSRIVKGQHEENSGVNSYMENQMRRMGLEIRDTYEVDSPVYPDASNAFIYKISATGEKKAEQEIAGAGEIEYFIQPGYFENIDHKFGFFKGMKQLIEPLDLEAEPDLSGVIMDTTVVPDTWKALRRFIAALRHQRKLPLRICGTCATLVVYHLLKNIDHVNSSGKNKITAIEICSRFAPDHQWVRVRFDGFGKKWFVIDVSAYAGKNGYFGEEKKIEPEGEINPQDYTDFISRQRIMSTDGWDSFIQPPALALIYQRGKWVPYELTHRQHDIINRVWKSLWKGGYNLPADDDIVKDITRLLGRKGIDLPVHVHSPPDRIFYEELYKLSRSELTVFPAKRNFRLITHPGTFRKRARGKKTARSCNLLIPENEINFLLGLRKKKHEGYKEWLDHEIEHILDRIKDTPDAPEKEILGVKPVNEFLKKYGALHKKVKPVLLPAEIRDKLTKDRKGANAIYTGAKISSAGKITGGNFIGNWAKTIHVPREIIEAYPDCVIKNVPGQSHGAATGIIIGGITLGKLFPKTKTGFTIIVERGEPARIYNNDTGQALDYFGDEGAANAMYIGGRIENGKLRESTFVRAFPGRAPGDILEQYSDCYVKNCAITPSGHFNFGITIFRDRMDLVNKPGLLAHFRNGRLVGLYEDNGTAITVSTIEFSGRTEGKRAFNEGGKNSVYINAEEKNGKRVCGTFIGNWPGPAGIPSEVLKKCGDCIIENVCCAKNKTQPSVGGLILGSDFKKAEKGIRVVVENGMPVRVFRKNGERAQFRGDKESRNALYLNADIENGRLKKGDFVKAFPARTPPGFLKKYHDFVVTNSELNDAGGYSFAAGGSSVWFAVGKYANAKGLTVVFKSGKPVEAYDKHGNLIFEYTQQQTNQVYVNARVVKGKRVGGECIGMYPKGIPDKLIENHRDFIVTNAHLVGEGMLIHGGKEQAMAGDEYAYEDDVTAVYKNAEAQSIYTKDGKKIFSRAKPKTYRYLYHDAKVRNGKRSGGTLIGRYESIPRDVLKKYPDAIIEIDQLSESTGGLGFGRDVVWPTREGLKGARNITVVRRKGKFVAAYDANGKNIFTLKKVETMRNAVYTGAQIVDGKRVGGEFIGAYPEGITQDLLNTHGDFIICNAKISDETETFSMGGKKMAKVPGYGGVDGVTVVVRHKKVTNMYDKKGNQIYPQGEKEFNAVYINAEIEKGKRKGGTFIGAYPQGYTKELLRKYRNFIVCNVTLKSPSAARAYMIRAFHLPDIPGYDGYKGATVVVEDGRAVAVYSRRGKRIFVQGERPQDTRTHKKFMRMFKDGDIERLVSSFGIEGTYRFLLNIHDLVPATLKALLSEYRRKRLHDKKKTESPALGQNPFSFVRMRKLTSIGDLKRARIDLLADEIIAAVYKDIARDHHFLETVLSESENTRNSENLRKAYKRVYDYYEEVKRFKIHGIDQDKIPLKFYQRMGIKFLIDKKKAILADEPGLGKTIQAIAAALNINKGKGAKKTLIICPKSAKKLWEREISDKTIMHYKAMVINSSKTLRGKTARTRLNGARFVIVNFEQIRGKRSVIRSALKKYDFDCVIVDEAHRMRNETLQTDAIRSFDAKHKYLLSGTPLVGRSPVKIFNLLHWLYPETFTNKTAFIATYVMTAGQMRQLSKDLRSCVMRRLKSDVLELPPPNYTTVPVTLGKEQRRLYDRFRRLFEAVVERNSKLRTTLSGAGLSELGGILSDLRMAAIDTALIEGRIIFDDGVKKFYVGPYQKTAGLNGRKYRICKDPDKKGQIYLVAADGKKYYTKIKEGKTTIHVRGATYTVSIPPKKKYHSAKYDALQKLVDDIIARGEKVVIFTQHRNVLYKLREQYKHLGVNYIIGRMSTTAMDREIQDFNENNDNKIFLATMQTGGEAISLTSANNVILVDKPWTAQEVTQAISRVHRIGQDKQVNVYSLVADNTIDEYIENIISHGSLVSQLSIEDDPTMKGAKGDLLTEILKRLKYSKEVIRQIKELAHKTGMPGTWPAKKLTTIVSDKKNNLKIQLKDDKLYASLANRSGERIVIKNVPHLLHQSKWLSPESKILIRRFAAKRIRDELDKNIPIKQSFLWLVMSAIQPTIAGLDYDGEVEMLAEIGRIILGKLIMDENTSLSDLTDIINDDRMTVRALRLFDKNNVFKALSLLGVLKKQFYYKAGLLNYDPPILVYEHEGRIKYTDYEIVERIAPDPIVAGVEVIPEKYFETQARQYRKLTREEEIRLARETKRGNAVAEDAIVAANMRAVIPLSRKLLASIKRRIGKLESILDGIMPDELYSAGTQALSECLETYYPANINKAFADFARPFMSKAINDVIHKHITLHIAEGPDVVGDDMFLPDLVLADAEAKKKVDIDAVGEYFGDSEIVRRVIKKLKDNGFREEEIDVFLEFTMGISVQELSKRYGMSTVHITDLIESAREILQRSRIFADMRKRLTEHKGEGTDGSPAEALRVIHREFGFEVFPKKSDDGQKNLYDLRHPYQPSTVDSEVRILKKLGILIMVKPGWYRLNPVLRGADDEETLANIKALYNMKMKTSPKRKENPLECGSIPFKKIPAVKELGKMELMHKLLEKIGTGPIFTEGNTVPKNGTCPYFLKIWSGYASSNRQKRLLQEIRKHARDRGYDIDFGNIRDEKKSLEAHVDFALSEKGKMSNTVIILPYGHDYVQKRIEQLKKANVIFMDYPDENLRSNEFTQIGGIIATGLAYVNNNDLAFMNLYRLLTGRDNPVTAAELRKDPTKLIFILEPIEEIDASALKYLNERMEELLVAA